jgi:hypothetical protein
MEISKLYNRTTETLNQIDTQLNARDTNGQRNPKPRREILRIIDSWLKLSYIKLN